jgi:pimeloyl-ACP methyl ester carboxylesterase
MESKYLEVSTGIKLFCQVQDFTDPWTDAETIVMVHGFAESSASWYAWIPYLARTYRVVLFDMRGYGKSTPMPSDFSWKMDCLLDDITAVAKSYSLEKFHLIGAKSGGSLVLQYAAKNPDKVISVVSVTPPVVGAKAVPDWLQQIEDEGVKSWARTTMPGRLGTNAKKEEIDWWVDHVQGLTPVSTLLGYLKWVPKLDLREEVLKVLCPTLIITTSGSGLRTVQSVEEWQRKMHHSSLLVVEGDAWHAAAAYPDICANAAIEFITKISVND